MAKCDVCGNDYDKAFTIDGPLGSGTFDAFECAIHALARIAGALRFPDWFGGNWDALADSLADLAWLPAPGYVLLLARTDAWRDADPEGFETLASILAEASARWARERVPFWALLPTPDPPRP
jgi:hypothetical protein